MLLKTGNFGSILRPSGRQMAEDPEYAKPAHLCNPFIWPINHKSSSFVTLSQFNLPRQIPAHRSNSVKSHQMVKSRVLAF